jgi:hypothetical protein
MFLCPPVTKYLYQTKVTVLEIHNCLFWNLTMNKKWEFVLLIQNPYRLPKAAERAKGDMQLTMIRQQISGCHFF